jgi:hypothetical protein
LLNRDADDFTVFFDIDRRRLAGGADHAQAVGALGNVPINQFAQSGVIHTAVGEHGGCQCGNAAFDGRE